MPPEIAVTANAEALAHAAAERFIALARESIAARGRFVVALAGGSTPRRTYELLADPAHAAQVDWSRTLVFMGDERLVPPSDERSNFGMASAALLSHVPLPPGNVFPVPTELGDGDAVARRYAETIAKALGAPADGPPPRFDLVLLGLGQDGHTASLFPHAASLRETRRWLVSSPPGTLPPPVDRVTFTYPMLNGARSVLFLVAGDEKAPVVASVLAGAAPEVHPSAGVAPSEGKLVWLLDQAAASALPKGAPGAAAGAASRAPVDVRLFVSDVDGTLVRHDQTLSPRTVQAVQALHAAGIRFALVSSRPRLGLRRLVAELKIDCPVAGFNGGIIVAPDLSALTSWPLPPEVAGEAGAFYRSRGLDVWVFRGDEWRVYGSDGAHVERERFVLGVDPVFMKEAPGPLEGVLKITGVSDDHAAVAATREAAQKAMAGRASVSSSQPHYVEATHPNANKGLAVREIARRLGIDLSQTAVIGDGRNDVEMFRVAAMSIAIGGAPPDVKAAAATVTGTNEEDGFAEAVERVILRSASR